MQSATISTETNSTMRAPRHALGAYLALGAVLLLALVLHFFRLDQAGYANLYYAATVKSMLTSWHNFFYAAYDPGGFVSVDKPPLGLWMQALSATIFGFSGWSLLLPQALAGVLSVALMYHLVARVFGAWAGVLAALVLTVSPIFIAANRNNTMDAQLVFTSLLAAWMVSIAIEKGKLRWLILGAIFVGIGFNIKMLQAVMVLPAFWLAYLIAARTHWYWRIAHLAMASIVLLIVSLAWVIAVDLTPADQRPFVGSSKNNTEMELIVGHNGVTRLGAIANVLGLRNAPVAPRQQAATKPQFPPPQNQPGQPPRFQPQPGQPGLPPQNQPDQPQPGQPGQPPQNQPDQPQPGQPGQPPQPGQTGQPTAPRGPNDETGEPGIFRLFNKQLAGQTSWLLPLALFGIIVLAAELFFARPVSRFTFYALLVWSTWLISQVVFFSFAGLFHRYYLEMLSPAIAALVGAGVVAMWNAYARRDWRGIILPFALFASAAVETLILLQFSEWNGWLIPVVIGLGILTFVALVILILLPRHSAIRISQIAFTVIGLATLLIAPTVWSFTPLLSADSGLPFAGPELAMRPARPANLPNENRLIEYLRANRGDTQFLVATLSAQTASPLILATGEPVMALGGFGGNDQILTPEQLAQAVAQNDVRFFWLPQGGNQNDDLVRWVSNNCARVNQASAQQPAPNPGGAQTLYDCARKN